MGQYKFSMYFKWQIGFAISIDEFTIEIILPFTSMYIGRLKDAEGVDLFGHYFKCNFRKK